MSKIVNVATSTINRQARNLGFSIPNVTDAEFEIQNADAGKNPDQKVTLVRVKNNVEGEKDLRFAVGLGDFHEDTKDHWKADGDFMVLNYENLLLTTANGKFELTPKA